MKTHNRYSILSYLIILSTFNIFINFVPLALIAEDGNDMTSEEPGKSYRVYKPEIRTENTFCLPINLYLNASFDVTQVPRAFSQGDIFDKYKKLFGDVKNPIHSIQKDGGYKKFFMDEFLRSRAVPNYTLHLIGGGYDFRMLAEWYDYHDVPAPYFFSFATVMAGHFGNEAVEMSNKNLSSQDHIADLYFFNLIGNCLFSSDIVADFFHDTMGLRTWYGQPVLDVRNKRIMNASLNYIFRPLNGRTLSPFIMMGMNYIGGISFKINNSDYLTLALGLVVKEPFNPDHETTYQQLKKSRLTGSIFYDRNGTLLASLNINGSGHDVLKLNIFPALFNFKNFNFGFFIALDDYVRVNLGISFYTIFGVGSMI
jgi:hypothetical protein